MLSVQKSDIVLQDDIIENVGKPSSDIFDKRESNVRYYCRSFPVVFDRAQNELIFDCDGREYIDFLAGAGALNYGHNNPFIKRKLVEYIDRDGITHSLDLHTLAKEQFIRSFTALADAHHRDCYKLMFCGPTGTNAVEAAMKLARQVTGRSTIGAFTNSFHGVSMGSLAATGSSAKRHAAGLPLGGVTRFAYDGYFGPDVDTIALIDRVLADPSSGFDAPAAFLVETIQGEGGVNVASAAWLQRLEELCRKHGSLLIVDDIQAGCGRSGSFFSYEPAGIRPDIVCLSKSLGGYGLPLAMLMIKAELDLWRPGAHNGTFRGNNHAFIAADAALSLWADEEFQQNKAALMQLLRQRVENIPRLFPSAGIAVRGKGLIWGLAVSSAEVADAICANAFRRGVVVETAGPHGEVIKLMPPLTARPELISEGLDLITQAIADQLGQDRSSNTLPYSGELSIADTRHAE
jgi:diaminobutyrate-2-oxoglutarate transaminase